MTIQARMYVAQIVRNAYNTDAAEVTLQAVSRGPENAQWAAATPAGQLKMTISNGAAGNWFADRLAKDVVLTFDDRPIICPDCNQEVPEGAHTIRYSAEGGKFEHSGCPEAN